MMLRALMLLASYRAQRTDEKEREQNDDE